LGSAKITAPGLLQPSREAKPPIPDEETAVAQARGLPAASQAAGAAARAARHRLPKK